MLVINGTSGAPQFDDGLMQNANRNFLFFSLPRALGKAGSTLLFLSLEAILVAVATTSSSVVSSTPILISLYVNPLSTFPLIVPFQFSRFSFASSPLDDAAILASPYPNKQGRPPKWSASTQLYNHCSSL